MSTFGEIISKIRYFCVFPSKNRGVSEGNKFVVCAEVVEVQFLPERARAGVPGVSVVVIQSLPCRV
jgi:hypothetical protein